MGIKGLLPYLSSSQRDVNVSSFRGQSVAVDAYCWLHKGCYSCATQLVMKTEKYENLPYVRYCMKRINLLRQYDITPIVVFDGAHLPMKRNTEQERRDRRKSYLQKGKALLKEGKQSEAFNCFQRCVDISPEMALVFIKELRKCNVQVIVAPYEADAQLAYLVKEGLAQLVITEDSDLLAFGCAKVLFKMDDNGNGKLIELSDIGRSVKPLIGFTCDSFRHVCILSGCDYLPSIPGVGVATAIKLMRKNNKNPYSVIKSLKRERVNKVPPNYENEFKKADETFLYQIVFDPRSEKQVRLTTPTSSELETDGEEFPSIGIYSSPSKQVALARGNINPLTMEAIDQYSPSKQKSLPNSQHRSTSWISRKSQSVSSTYPIKQKQSVISATPSARKQFKNPVIVKAKGNAKCHDSSSSSDDEVDLAELYGGGIQETGQTSITGNTSTQSRNVFSKSTVLCTSKYFHSTQRDTVTPTDNTATDTNNITDTNNSTDTNGPTDTNNSTDTNGSTDTNYLTDIADSTDVNDPIDIIEPTDITDSRDTGTLSTIIPSASSNSSSTSTSLLLLEEHEKPLVVVTSEQSTVDMRAMQPLSNCDNVCVKKRLSLDSSAYVHDSKRMKLDTSASQLDRFKGGVVNNCTKKKAAPMRLGLSKRFNKTPSSNDGGCRTSDNMKGTNILSYFCYKSKDKLAL